MNVFFYVPINGEVEVRLQQEVEGLVSRKKRVVCRTIDRLFRKLQQVPMDQSIAVLLAANLEDLFDLFSIRNLLEEIKIILILPDREKRTVAMGHILRPRFLSYADSNFKDVGAVLRKMMLIENKNN